MSQMKMPKALLDLIQWDESKGEYFYLIPISQTIQVCRGVSKPILARYRVEICPEGYTVLIPQ